MKTEIRKILFKHTEKVDNWNDAIFSSEFDNVVDELNALVLRKVLIEFVTWQTYSSNLGITIEDRVDIYLKNNLK